MTYLRQTADKITKGLPPSPQEPTPDKGAGPYGTEQAEINKVAPMRPPAASTASPCRSRPGWDGTYLTKEQSENWYYAVGGIQHSATGTVTVYPPDIPGGPPHVEAQYQTHVWDRYNWDHGKGVEIGGVPALDDNQGRLHRTGLAQEYDITGSSSVRNYRGTAN